MNTKRLTRSLTDRKLAGVCGGLAAYFNVDATLVRLGWLIVTIFSAGIGGLVAYIVCVVVVPEE